MELFYVISGVYFLSIFYLLFRGFTVNTRGGYCGNNFLQKEHTDTIKGIAAVGIVLMHIATHTKGIQLSGIPYYYIKVCKTLGCLGVDLFFFLSGYGNYYSIKKTKNRKERLKWLWHHVSHILLMYLICYVVCLVVLCMMGDRPTMSKTIYNLTHLRGPRTQIWYVRVQLLLYVFLALSWEEKKEKIQIVVLFFLSFVSSYWFYRTGFGEEWWMSTICFGMGCLFTKFKHKVFPADSDRYKLIAILCLVLFPIAYYLGIGTDFFLAKVFGNALLSWIMIILAVIFGLYHKIYSKIGILSLPIYIIHTTFISYFISDHIPTNIKVVLIFLLTVSLSCVSFLLNQKVLKCISIRR